MAGIVALVLVGGFFLARSALDALASNPSASPSVSPSQSRSPSPSPSPSPSVSPTPSPTRSVTPSPSRTGPPEGPRPCRYEGKAATQAQVKSALEAAAAYKVWRSVSISVPSSLVKAVAKHESGWQSNAVSCQGAFGVMQVMPETAGWLNERFADTLGGQQNYRSLSGNTRLGSAYLQWTVKKIGDDHFGGNYSLKACAPSERCLLNAVISAYEVGEATTSAALAAGRSWPNPDYIANVRYWMARY